MQLSHSRLLLGAVFLCALGSLFADEERQTLFEDPFDSKLGDGWSWVREDPKGWRIDKGALVIRTSTGGLWKRDNNTENLLVRKLPDSKDSRLAVEVLVENEPTNDFEHAGLVWYCDDDNYVILVKEKVGAKPIVQLVSEKEGNPKTGFAEKPYEAKSVWLRLELTDKKAVAKFRKTEKDDWQTLGECDLPRKGEARIGLLTGYAAKNAEHSSRFSGFRIVEGAK